MSDCTGPHTSVFDCPEHSPTRPAPERTEGESKFTAPHDGYWWRDCIGYAVRSYYKHEDAEKLLARLADALRASPSTAPDPADTDAAQRDALWREYEAARERLERAAYDIGANDYGAVRSGNLTASRERARARLDAAVRALAAAPREREGES